MNFVSGFNFDTYNTITADCSEVILKKAIALCDPYEKLLSKTIEGSDVWRINHADGAPVQVSEDTLNIVKMASKLNEESEGAFNIAVGEVINLWKFTSGEKKIPRAEDIEKAVQKINSSYLYIENDFVSINPGTSIDLGGIAKGYITDRIADFLRKEGVKSALLNFGGNVVALGRKPDGSQWQVGLQSPGGQWGKEHFAVIGCADRTIVTSGIYERGFEIEGVRYHHIVDPKTGWPVKNDLLSVSAIAKDSMLADGITTAMFVLGIEKGSRLAEKNGVDYVYLKKNGQIVVSEGIYSNKA